MLHTPALRPNANTEINARPSREDIEVFVMLDALARGARSIGELAEHLGLSPALAEAVTTSVDPLVARGLIDRQADKVSLSESGAVWLRERRSRWLGGKRLGRAA
jgi:predicted transcriptional regulator